MTAKNRKTLGDLFAELDLLGDFQSLASIELGGIAEAERAKAGDLVFLAQEKFVAAAAQAPAAALVVSDSLWDAVQKAGPKAPTLRSRDAMLAFAKASRHFSTEACPAGVHPTAYIHPTAKVSPKASVGPFVVVGEQVEIAEGVILHSHVQIGARSKVGPECVLFSGVVLYQDVQLGRQVRIHGNTVIGADGFGYVQEKTPNGVRHVKIHHLGGVKIGDRTEIGAGTTIDRGTLGDTVIAEGCIIDNQVQIGHNCQLGEGVIICGCVGVAGSARIEKFALLAGFSAVSNKVTVGAGAQVAGFTAVIGDVPPGAKWSGIPAMPRGENARMQVLLKRLPELFEAKRKEKKS